VGTRGRAHVNTAYFAWSPELDIVWLSDPRAGHSRNLRANPSAAVAVYASTQTWGEADRGIQLFGTAQEATGERAAFAADQYARRFSGYAREDLSGYRLYVFRPRTIKIFDEVRLGGGVFVTAAVDRAGRTAWRRTELYRSTT
jgi:uncharacterized protein YhbP (UPF0306 family)